MYLDRETDTYRSCAPTCLGMVVYALFLSLLFWFAGDLHSEPYAAPSGTGCVVIGEQIGTRGILLIDRIITPYCGGQGLPR